MQKINLLIVTAIFIIVGNQAIAQPFWNVYGGNTLVTGSYIGGDVASAWPFELKTLTA